jgi:hypothetical protein
VRPICPLSPNHGSLTSVPLRFQKLPRLNCTCCHASIIRIICTVALTRTGILVKWCLDNSISSEVTTPVSAQDLASALISALESSTVSPAAATNDVIFDILLAEDNLVNQKLAVKILEKYGHTVEIAENGSLAVDAFKARVQRNRPFDIILVRVPPRLLRPGSKLRDLMPDGRFYAFHGRHGGD